MDLGLIGLCMSVFDFGIIFTGPFAPHVVQRLGAKKSITFANVFAGILSITFAFFSYIPSSRLFTFMCFVIFFLEGMTLSIMNCAVYGRLDYLYGRDVSFASGCLQGANAFA